MKREGIKVCILRVGGTNCDAETRRAFQELGVQAEVVHVNDVVKRRSLLEFNALVFPGGFSYGDYVRAGAIWAKWMLAKLGGELKTFVEEELLKDSGWGALLKTRRLMTPALHAAISEALARFALKLVRYVIEERHIGRVIYAGGDDVLAFLPLDEALPAARELRALFSGEVRLANPIVSPQALDLRKQDWVVAFGDPECTGYLRLDGEILLTMGPTATASIGVAFAHHLQPLDAVLEAARQAERAAKDFYGRNAVCIHLLKRSGEESRVGCLLYTSPSPRD